MGQKFTDAARSTLTAGITAGDTTLTLTDAALFPLADTGTSNVSDATDWFKAVIQDSTGFEVIYVRTRDNITPNNLTNVLRGQDGTTARSFDAGSVVGLRPLASDMGNVSSTHSGRMSAEDKTKLDGVATAATANSSDAALLNRANHTGTQTTATITGLDDALAGKAPTSHTHTTANVTGLDTALAALFPRSGGTFSGGVATSSTTGVVTSVIGSNLQVMASGAENGAFMSFHRSSLYAINFGLDPDNVVRLGGWSQGSGISRWAVDAAGYMTVPGGLNKSPAHRTPAINLGGGTTVDLAAGTDFFTSISANTTITISNASGGGGLAQAVSLLLYHGGGTITFSATGHTIRWAGGSAPTLTTGRWHQFFIWPDPMGPYVLISCVSYY